MMQAQPLVLPPLPYPPNGLEPALTADQVKAHYELHHAAYVNKANDLLARVGGTLEGFGRAPSGAWQRYVFNVNGARLHDLFWATYCPGGSNRSPWITEQIGHDFFSLRRDLVSACADLEGSGWTCLSMDTGNGNLGVHNVSNHDYPWDRFKPLIVLDGWEHAYYLDYLADRKRYAEALLALVNWPAVEQRIRG